MPTSERRIRHIADTCVAAVASAPAVLIERRTVFSTLGDAPTSIELVTRFRSASGERLVGESQTIVGDRSVVAEVRAAAPDDGAAVGWIRRTAEDPEGRAPEFPLWEPAGYETALAELGVGAALGLLADLLVGVAEPARESELLPDTVEEGRSVHRIRVDGRLALALRDGQSAGVLRCTYTIDAEDPARVRIEGRGACGGVGIAIVETIEPTAPFPVLAPPPWELAPAA